jgi:hypothetical protein
MNNSIIMYSKRHLHRLTRATGSLIKVTAAPFDGRNAIHTTTPILKLICTTNEAVPTTRFFSTSSPSLPVDQVLGSIQKNFQENVSTPTTKQKKSSQSAASLLYYKMALDESPSYALHAYYRSTYNMMRGLKPHYEQEAANASDEYWTATFVCPYTQQRYPSGTLDDQNNHAAIAHGGRVFYKSKKHAVRAASARALDAIQYQVFNVVEPRLCQEVPLEQEEQQSELEDQK